MVQTSFDTDTPRCAWPGGCRAPARRTLDTGAGVVGACAAHQQTPWWASCVRAADRALADARRAWGIEPPDETGCGHEP